MKGFEVGRLKRTRVDIRLMLLVFSILSVFFILLLNSYFSYKTAAAIILNKIQKIDESNLNQINNKINIGLGEMERLTEKVKKNRAFYALLEEYKASRDNTYEMLNVEKSILHLLSSNQDIYRNIYNMEVVTEFANFSITGTKTLPGYEKMINSDIYKKIKESKNGIFIMEPGYTDKAIDLKFKQFCLGTMLHDGTREIGMIFILMDGNWLNTLLNFDQNTFIANSAEDFVVWSGNEKGKAVYNAVKGSLTGLGGFFEYNPGNEKYRLYYTSSKYNSWVVGYYRNIQEIEGQVNEVRKYSILSYLVGMVFCLIAALIFANLITKPIYRLMKSVKKYKLDSLPGSLKIGGIPFRLKNIFLLYFIVIIIVPMIISSVTQYFTLSGVIEKKILDSINLAFRQTTDNIDYFIDINERITKSIIYDKSLRQYLLDTIGGVGIPDEKERLEVIQRSIDDSMFLGESVFETAIYDTKGAMLYSTSVHNNSDLNSDFLKTISTSMGNPVWLYYDRDRFNRNTIRLFRKIIEDGSIRSDYQFKTIGYISVTYYETNIEELYRDLNIGNNNVYIIDPSGVIVSHRQKAMLNQKDQLTFDMASEAGVYSTSTGKGENRQLLVLSRCSKIPLALVGQTPYSEIMRDNRQIIYTSIYLFLIILIPILVFSNYVAYRIAKPVNRLAKRVEAFGGGQMEVEFVEKTFINEIQELGYTFGNMASRIKELIDKVYTSEIKESRLENEKKEAELIALKAQINPHFLYNTLESVIWLVKCDEKEKAAEMISDLGDLFRLGVKKGEEYITIREEIEYDMIYINIHKNRLEDKLTVKWDIDETLLGYKIPKMILQPVIENAIQHGVQENINGGGISIQCRKEDGDLLFVVKDDGPGIGMEKLEDLTRRLNENLTGDSIGIFNVQKRIRLYFGAEYGITLESAAGHGTTVIMRLPLLAGMGPDSPAEATIL